MLDRVAAAVTPAEPKLQGSLDDRGHGRWYTGAQPQADAQLPVVVFVPGLGDYAPSFWKGNDIYRLAYNDGFRTAFVSFMADGEAPFDMWENGKMFAAQLELICRFYNEKNVMVVAHSKGGVDAQTAAVYFGATPMIRKLITLSTPHWGSQLADLAYSSVGWELAQRLNQHSKGSFCMQTSYMRSFRQMTDANPLNTVEMECFGGNGSAPPFSELWAGEKFMSLYGENDGVVTVSNAHNPKGIYRQTTPLNHAEMMSGKVWPALKPALMGQPAQVLAAGTVQAAPSGVIFRGGGMENGVGDEFPVDSTVKSMEVFVAVAGGSGEYKNLFQLYSPAGAPAGSFDVMSGPFGMKLLRLSIAAPQPGRWHLICTGAQGAYFARIGLNDTFAVTPVAEKLGDIARQGVAAATTALRVLKTGADAYESLAEHRNDLGGFAAPLRLPQGAYTLESAVRGALADGSEFERDVLRPVISGGMAALRVAEVVSGLL